MRKSGLLNYYKKRGKENGTQTKGIIFTAIPDESNEYYEPFYEELIYFNENLNEKKGATDQLISLSVEEQDFHTSFLSMMIFG